MVSLQIVDVDLFDEMFPFFSFPFASPVAISARQDKEWKRVWSQPFPIWNKLKCIHFQYQNFRPLRAAKSALFNVQKIDINL